MVLPRPIVFGNWKMHGLRADALALAGALAGHAGQRTGTLGIFPPFTVIAEVARGVGGSALVVGGQDCHPEPKGAFTGSIAAGMLRDAGATAVIVGHSERRHGLGETDALVKAKATAGLAAGLLVVLCVGETEAQRAAGETVAVLDRQLAGSWPVAADAATLVVAYEPVWAIGTGKTATLADIAESHAAIGRRLAELAPDAGEIAILYGGSVKAENARDIMAVPGVAGVLVGGASLDAAGFWSIYQGGGGA
jgi:triosephosphate isomerase (TIM)